MFTEDRRGWKQYMRLTRFRERLIDCGGSVLLHGRLELFEL